MNERLKEIRMRLQLTQKDFAEKIGATQQTIAMFENGSRQLSMRYIKVICAAFNVSESWFREGCGNIFTVDRQSAFNEYLNAYNMGDTERNLLEIYHSLSQEERDIIIGYIKKFADGIMNPKKSNKTKIFRAAKSDGNDVPPHFKEYTDEQIFKLKNSPETDEDL